MNTPAVQDVKTTSKALSKTPDTSSRSISTPGKMDKYQCLSLCLSGMLQKDVAKQLNVTESAVSHAMKPYRKHIDFFIEYDKDPVKFMRFNRSKVSAALQDGKLKKMSGKDLVTAEAILTDKIQLLEGKSTQNIAIMDVTREQNNIREELKRRGLDHLLDKT
jgi:predicted transcriptional regulator